MLKVSCHPSSLSKPSSGTWFLGSPSFSDSAKLVSRIPASADLHFVPMKTIMSVHFPQVNNLLFPERPFSFQAWQKFFAQSSAVHFFSKTTSLLASTDDPRHSAYALLGPRYCPRSYYSTKNF